LLLILITQNCFSFLTKKVDYSTIDSKHDTLKSDKHLIHDDSKPTTKETRNRMQSYDDNSLPNIDILTPSQRSNRSHTHEVDSQTRKNYEIADRIANQLAQEEELRQQHLQPQQQLPKQLTARYDSYNNSFSAGLDSQPQPNNNANLYSLSTGMKSPVKTKQQQQQPEEFINEPPKKLPTNRPKIEFPKSPSQPQQQQEVMQQPNRKYSNRSQEVSSDQNIGSDCKFL
jgi:hypothetical protein